MSGSAATEIPPSDVEMGNEEVEGASQPISEVSKPVDLGQAVDNDNTGVYENPFFPSRQ